MMTKRMAILALVGLSLITVGCSSSKKQDAAATASSEASSASSALSSSTTTKSGSGDSSTTKAPSGSATGDSAAFCAGFTDLSAINDSSSVSDKDAGAAALKSAAQKIRDNAPADIAESANAYADLLDKAADALSSSSNEAEMAQAMQGMVSAGTGQAIVPVVKYAATNCLGN